MTAILLTGMSGVGKSTVLAELERRGWQTVDTDLGDWITIADATTPYPGERVWNVPALRDWLDDNAHHARAVVGTVINQGELYDRFDAVVLLTVDVEIALARVIERTGNPFGSTEAQREQIRRDFAEVEPLLRARATHVIDTSAQLSDVVTEIARIASP